MLSTEDMTKEEREEYWEMVIEDFVNSNLSKAVYCQNNDIPLSTFRYWEGRLKEKEHDNSICDRFVELPIPNDHTTAIQLSCDTSAGFTTELMLTYESINIHLNSGTPMQLLRNVLIEVGYAE